MDREQMEKLAAADINSGGAMARLMGSVALYKKYMEMFVQDRTYFDLCRAVSAGDWRQAQDASHTLKGICGNLSMTVLYKLFSSQVTLLREGRSGEAAALMPQIDDAYAKAVQAAGQMRTW